MSLELLRNDFLRFSMLHSWYKHIRKTFYFYLGKGQQIRHPIDPQVDDEEGEHFRFTKAPPNENIKYGTVVFGPFLRGKFCSGFHIIQNDYGEERFDEWIRTNYPEYHTIYKDQFKSQCCVAEKEQDKYWNRLVEAYQSYQSYINHNSHSLHSLHIIG